MHLFLCDPADQTGQNGLNKKDVVRVPVWEKDDKRKQIFWWDSWEVQSPRGFPSDDEHIRSYKNTHTHKCTYSGVQFTAAATHTLSLTHTLTHRGMHLFRQPLRSLSGSLSAVLYLEINQEVRGCWTKSVSLLASLSSLPNMDLLQHEHWSHVSSSCKTTHTYEQRKNAWKYSSTLTISHANIILLYNITLLQVREVDVQKTFFPPIW